MPNRSYSDIKIKTKFEYLLEYFCFTLDYQINLKKIFFVQVLYYNLSLCFSQQQTLSLF